VLAEVVLLHERGRIGIGATEVRVAMEATPALRFLPLDFKQLEEFAAHQQIAELFDRLILAATRAVGGQLITKDSVLCDSPLLETVWG
jgi:PIN domain nuclease of toxin-antitoxin system